MRPVAPLLLAAAWVLLARWRRPPRPRPVPAQRPVVLQAAADDPPGPGDRPVRVRWVTAALVAVVATTLVGPVAGAIVLGAPAAARWRRGRRHLRDAEAAVVDQVPEVIDLLALALGAGLSVTESMAAVGRWAPGPVGDALAAAHVSVAHGGPTADALEAARDRCGPPAAGLFSALVAADRYGTPLGPSLDRLGHEARLDRRRAAEERARKVPVQLLFPLVVCVLPAFGLLTVVPLLVNSLGAIS